MVSDLGGGKTVFIKGLARGLGYPGEVTSPTFTISRVYPLLGGNELYHFDFYRLAAGDMAAAELVEAIHDPRAIIAVEWAGQAGNVLPPERLVIKIDHMGGTERRIKVAALGRRYLPVIASLAKQS